MHPKNIEINFVMQYDQIKLNIINLAAKKNEFIE